MSQILNFSALGASGNLKDIYVEQSSTQLKAETLRKETLKDLTLKSSRSQAFSE